MRQRNHHARGYGQRGEHRDHYKLARLRLPALKRQQERHNQLCDHEGARNIVPPPGEKAYAEIDRQRKDDEKIREHRNMGLFHGSILLVFPV